MMKGINHFIVKVLNFFIKYFLKMIICFIIFNKLLMRILIVKHFLVKANM